MAETARRRVSYEEYLAIDAQSEGKHEFVEGLVYAMAGGTRLHARLAARLVRVLGQAHTGGPADAYGSDLRVRVVARQRAYYPDATVVCGEGKVLPGDSEGVIDPRVVAEVPSPSSEAIDRGEKLEAYQAIETLGDYLIASTKAARIEHYQRAADGSWSYRACGPGAAIALATGATLRVDDIYDGVTLDPTATERP